MISPWLKAIAVVAAVVCGGAGGALGVLWLAAHAPYVLLGLFALLLVWVVRVTMFFNE